MSVLHKKTKICQVAADPMSMQYERAAHFSKLHPTTDLTLQVRDIFFLGAFFLLPVIGLF